MINVIREIFHPLPMFISPHHVVCQKFSQAFAYFTFSTLLHNFACVHRYFRFEIMVNWTYSHSLIIYKCLFKSTIIPYSFLWVSIASMKGIEKCTKWTQNDIWKSDYACNKNHAHKDHTKTPRQRNATVILYMEQNLSMHSVQQITHMLLKFKCWATVYILHQCMLLSVAIDIIAWWCGIYCSKSVHNYGKWCALRSP